MIRLLPMLILVPLLLILLFGCDDMSTQDKVRPYRNPGREHAATPQAPAPGTVQFRERPVPPPPLTLALIERGQDRYRQFCTPCHSELGDGHGMVVQRGFSPPPSYHIPRLVNAPTRHFYDVITNGYGAMYSFAVRVPPRDRWAIAAYIRSLQRMDQGTPADLEPGQQVAESRP